MKFKKIIGQMAIATLLVTQLSTPITLLAQEGQVVDYQFSVKLNLPDETTQDQKHIKYDIFNRDTDELIYSYRETNPENEVIALFEGNYRLRIYDWDTISQDGQLIVDEFEQSIAEPTQEELNDNKTKRVHRLPGDEVVLGDGSIVYDIDFEVKASDYLFDDVAQEYQGFFNLYLADPQTAQANDDKNEISQPSYEEEGQTGSVVIQTIDAQTQQPIEGVTLDLSGTIIQSDVNGSIRADGIEIGDYILTTVSLPEGYQGEVNEVITVEAYSETIITLPFNQTVSEASLANAVFYIEDTQGNPVSGVGILIDGVESYSDQNGQVVFKDLPAGNYHYDLNGLPSGYQGEASGELTIDPTQGDAQTTLTIERVAETGNVVFRVVDQTGLPVSNAGIWFLDKLIYTQEDGTVNVNGLELTDYNYVLSELPSGYIGENTGSFSLVMPNETVETLIQIEKETLNSVLTISVKDEHGLGVPNVKLLIDDQYEVITDEEGRTYHRELAVGEHQVVINELPNQFRSDQMQQTVYLPVEGGQIEFSVESIPQTETVNLLLQDQFGQPLTNAIVLLDDQQATSDGEGRVVFNEITHGVHSYQVTQLPEKFETIYEGQITISESNASHTIELSRSVDKGMATLTVANQDNHPVKDVIIQFGGLTGTTNEEGKVVFENLDLGNYHYKITQAPADINFEPVEKIASIEEASQFADTLIVNQVKSGNVKINIQDEQNQGVSGIEVKIDGQSYRTDQSGTIILNDLSIGDHTYQLIDSSNYQFEQKEGSFTVEAGQTKELVLKASQIITTTEAPTTISTTQLTTTTVTETTASPITTTTLTSVNQANMKQLIDSTSNVEVWVHPDDANLVQRIAVDRVTQQLPAALVNKEVDVFNIRLLDANGQEVNPSKTVQVKIPTRTINSQVQLVRVSNDQLTTINHSIHNQRANFITQQLGQYALVYGDKVPAATEAPTTTQSQTLAVETSTSVERRIPNTGETNSFVYIVLAALLIGFGGFLVFKKKQ